MCALCCGNALLTESYCPLLLRHTNESCRLFCQILNSGVETLFETDDAILMKNVSGTFPRKALLQSPATSFCMTYNLCVVGKAFNLDSKLLVGSADIKKSCKVKNIFVNIRKMYDVFFFL